MVFTSRDMHTCSFSRPSAGEGLRRVGHPEGELIRFVLAALGFHAAEASQCFRRAKQARPGGPCVWRAVHLRLRQRYAQIPAVPVGIGAGTWACDNSPLPSQAVHGVRTFFGASRINQRVWAGAGDGRADKQVSCHLPENP